MTFQENLFFQDFSGFSMTVGTLKKAIAQSQVENLFLPISELTVNITQPRFTKVCNIGNKV